MFNNLEESNPTPPVSATPPEPNTVTPAASSSGSTQTMSTPSMAEPSHAPVDDIFAETDAYSSGRSNGDIETKKVGLISENEKFVSSEDKKPTRGIFKILTILILVIILGLGGYLAYTKFFSSSPTLEQNLNSYQPPIPTPVVPVTPVVPDEVETPTEPAITTPLDTTDLETEPTTPTEPVTPIFVPIIDSDDDGLTDDEEIVAGTNINIIDTDNDGLSDYEEVKIYKSNPLSADSDADGYQDGQEVRGGYDPNGPGKLPGNAE